MRLTSTELRSFFYGTLLGDSYIHNGVFYCKQISKDLIQFKKSIIESHLPDAKVRLTERPAYTDKNGVAHQKFYVLSASSSEYIKKLEKLFYVGGRKVYPSGAASKLTELGMAMWYADDGTTILVTFTEATGSARSRRVQICTDNFTREEHVQIIKDLQDIGLTAYLVERKRKDQVRIKLDLLQSQHLFASMGEYFIKYFPSLIYKMDLGYRNESLTNRKYVLKEYSDFYSKIKTNPNYHDRLVGRSDDIVQTTTLPSGLGNQE